MSFERALIKAGISIDSNEITIEQQENSTNQAEIISAGPSKILALQDKTRQDNTRQYNTVGTKHGGIFGLEDLDEIEEMIIEDDGLLYVDVKGQITEDESSAVDIVKPLRFYSIKYRVFVECDEAYLLGASGSIYKYFKTKGHYRAMSKDRTAKLGYRTRISYKGQDIKDRLDVYLAGAIITTFIDEDYDSPIGNNSEYRQGKAPTLLNVRKMNK